MPAAPAPSTTLSARTMAGGRMILFAQAARFVVRVATAMTLARLLAPGDYGLFGMAAAVHGLLYLIRDSGTGPAVQESALTPERFNALCRVGAIGGVVLAVVCAAAGPAAAWFYHEPQLIGLLPVLALCFPFAGASAPMQALLYREQRIGRAAAVEVGAIAAASAVAVIAAALGAKAWALVVMTVLNELIACALYWRICPWRPASPDGPIPWGKLLVAGAQLNGRGLADYFARTCDQIVIGRVAGTAALGLYGRGAQVAALPMQFSVAPFTGWIIAALARFQPEAEAYRAFFRTALNGLAHLTLPAAAICVAAPDLVIGLFYGAQWREAAPVVRWLGVALAVQPWLFAHVWLLLSVQRTRRLLVLSLVVLAASVGAAWAVRHAGLATMAAAMAATAIGSAGFTLAAATGITPVRGLDVAQASWRPWVLHGGLGGALGLVHPWLAARCWPVAGVAGGLALAAAAYLTAVLAGWAGARAEWKNHFLWRR